VNKRTLSSRCVWKMRREQFDETLEWRCFLSSLFSFFFSVPRVWKRQKVCFFFENEREKEEREREKREKRGESCKKKRSFPKKRRERRRRRKEERGGKFLKKKEDSKKKGKKKGKGFGGGGVQKSVLSRSKKILTTYNFTTKNSALDIIGQLKLRHKFKHIHTYLI